MHDHLLESVAWNAEGLVPAIAQERASGDVLMMAWMNREALRLTLTQGEAIYYSRSRSQLWHKGAISGHTQTVHTLRLDCDRDALLLSVTQNGHHPGIACHTGRHSCFYLQPQNGQWVSASPVLKDPAQIYSAAQTTPTAAPEPAPVNAPVHAQDVLAYLSSTLESRKPAYGGDPRSSYVARLLANAPDAFLKKIGEEATELVMAAKDGSREQIVYEMADLWFHCLIALSHFELRPDAVLAELSRRAGNSGLNEKAMRKLTERAQAEAVSQRHG